MFITYIDYVKRILQCLTDHFESFFCDSQCFIDFCALMTHGHKVAFKWTWRIVNTVAQVMMEEHFELFFITSCCIIEVLNWFISEEDGEHGAYSLHNNRHIVLCRQSFKAVAKGNRRIFYLFKHRWM